MVRRYRFAAALIAFAAFGLLSAGAPKMPLVMRGMYVEGCSCSPPCPCELTGVSMGCEGVGAFRVDSGTFNGVSLAGLKFAYASAPGEWIACYVQAKNPAQRTAAMALCKAAFGPWGKMAPTRDAKISIEGTGGKCHLMVDGGKVMDMTTKPVMGGDGKSPIAITNINSVLHPIVMQGKTVKCKYNDGGHTFEISDTNAYFNDRLRANGKL